MVSLFMMASFGRLPSLATRILMRLPQIEVVGQPVVDAGGVLHQCYTDMFEQFANNTLVSLLAGSDSFL
jgi:hypothetical protein